MTEEQLTAIVNVARARYDALTAEWRDIDRRVNALTVFGNQRWTPDMLTFRRQLLAMLRKRLAELDMLVNAYWGAYQDALTALELAEQETKLAEMANAA